MKKLVLTSAFALALAAPAMAGTLTQAGITAGEGTTSMSTSHGFGSSSNTSVAGNTATVNAGAVSGSANLFHVAGVNGSDSNVTEANVGGSSSTSRSLGNASSGGVANQGLGLTGYAAATSH
jgi:hypothetical protein